MKTYFTLFLLSISALINAQQYNSDNVSKRVMNLYEKAIALLRDEQFKEAVPLLLTAIKEDSNFVDGYLSLAGTFGELKQYKRSIRFYETAHLV